MSDYRFNVRHATANDLQRVRRFLRDIRDNGGATVDASAKAAFIYSVQYAFYGEKGLNDVRPMVERKLGRAKTVEAELKIATMSGNAERATELLIEAFNAAEPDVQDRMLPNLISSQMLCGRVDVAIDLALNRLRSPASLRPAIERWLALSTMRLTGVEQVLAVSAGLADRYPRMKLALALGPAAPPEVPMFCLNLDRDKIRYQVAERALSSSGTKVHRVAGVPGSALPQSLLDLTGLPITVERRAQVGCHLSHWSAWEKIAAQVPESEYGLVVEDDAMFVFGPGVGVTQAVAAAKAQDLDLLFLQMEPLYHQLSSGDVFTTSPTTLDPLDILSAPDAKSITGWGGEGYLLNPLGARKLLDIASKVGIVAALDNQLVAYAMAIQPETGKALGRDLSKVFPSLAALRAGDPERFFVKARVMSPSLILQADYGYKPHNVETVLQRASGPSSNIEREL